MFSSGIFLQSFSATEIYAFAHVPSGLRDLHPLERLGRIGPTWGMFVFGKLYCYTAPFSHGFHREEFHEPDGSQFSDKLNKQTCDL